MWHIRVKEVMNWKMKSIPYLNGHYYWYKSVAVQWTGIHPSRILLFLFTCLYFHHDLENPNYMGVLLAM